MALLCPSFADAVGATGRRGAKGVGTLGRWAACTGTSREKKCCEEARGSHVSSCVPPHHVSGGARGGAGVGQQPGPQAVFGGKRPHATPRSSGNGCPHRGARGSGKGWRGARGARGRRQLSWAHRCCVPRSPPRLGPFGKESQFLELARRSGEQKGLHLQFWQFLANVPINVHSLPFSFSLLLII